MKKLILAAGIIAISAGLNATNAQQTKLGVKGGVSFTGVSSLSGNDRTSGHVGLFLQSKINQNWAFQPELLYSGQGQHYTNDLDQRKVLSLDYLQLPLMVQYYPAPKVYLEAGPQVGLLLSSQTKDAGTGNHNKSNDDNYRSADIGINAGLGVNITNRIGIYGRYTQGLMDITKSTDNSRTNHGVQLGAAIKF